MRRVSPYRVFWKSTLLVGFLCLAATGHAAPKRSTAAASASTKESPHLQVVSSKRFCHRLHAVFQDFAHDQGYNRVQTALLAANATRGIVEQFRAGRASDYVNASVLAAYAKAPEKVPEQTYVPLAGFLKPAMGVDRQVMLALSSAELRFIPHAQKGQSMVVIANNAASLTPPRTRKVAAVASKLDISISIVWVGEKKALATKKARSLAWLAAVTGGTLADLGGQDEACGVTL